ncbi:MAG: DUF5606 family protein [Bacteroidia bacterium]
MDLSGLISINGMPGLYKVVGQMKNGVVAESLTDKKRIPVMASQQLSALEEISMFTTGENKPVSEILKTIFEKEKGGKCIDHKADEKEIVSYFTAILPDYDKERVYVSNMRKLFNWYNLLQETGNLKLKEDGEKSEDKKKVTHAEDHTKKFSAAQTKVKADTKGAKKTSGVRKTGVA